jgi:carboxymethylenebutenolidase
LAARLKATGKNVTITVHPGTAHTFMAPHNALGTFDEAKGAEIWPQAVKFLRDKPALSAAWHLRLS